MLLFKPALEICPRVYPRGGVALHVYVVTASGGVPAPEEVVEADLVESG